MWGKQATDVECKSIFVTLSHTSGGSKIPFPPVSLISWHSKKKEKKPASRSLAITFPTTYYCTMGKIIKSGKVVVMLAGRYAGRKAIVVKCFDEGNNDSIAGIMFLIC